MGSLDPLYQSPDVIDLQSWTESEVARLHAIGPRLSLSGGLEALTKRIVHDGTHRPAAAARFGADFRGNVLVKR